MSNFKTSPKKPESKIGPSIMNLSYEDARARLITLVKEKALFAGDSLLPSGQITSHYLDPKEALLSAEGAFLASMTALHHIKDEVSFIGGSLRDAYSLPVGCSQLAFMRGQDIGTFYVRDATDARRKGLSKWIEGPLEPATKVCLIQDMVVDGANLIDMMRILKQEADSEIVQVIAIIDRLDGAKYRFQDFGVDYTSIITMHDIMEPVRN